jgi:hypothetical protein
MSGIANPGVSSPRSSSLRAYKDSNPSEILPQNYDVICHNGGHFDFLEVPSNKYEAKLAQKGLNNIVVLG